MTPPPDASHDGPHLDRAPTPWPAIGAVVLLGLSLRLLFGSGSALLPEIRAAYDLDGAGSALVTAAPVAALGLVGPAAAPLARRLPVSTVLIGALLVVAAGTAIRVVPSWPVLVAGTLVAGAGIAVANVLGPLYVRLRFPTALGPVTGVFTACVCLSAGVASGASAPLDDVFLHDWRLTLASWAILPVLAVLALLIAGRVPARDRYRAAAPPPPEHATATSVVRSPVAWAVTGYMGLQSLLAYVVIGWLPTIQQDRGVDSAQAGLALTVVSVASIATALTAPVVAVRLLDQRVIAPAVAGLSLVGLIGLACTGPDLAYVWAVLLGLGQGAQLSLALLLVNLRSATHADAARLSALAQSVGYVVAALGPVVAGAVHQATGTWTTPLVGLSLVAVALAVCGRFAGRDRTVGAAPDQWETDSPSDGPRRR